jgi:hypothetical protein
MQKGAVALIDALGFRGIWSRHTPDAVLNEMKSVKNWFETRIKDQFATQPDFHCDVAFLSDTIAVSMAFDGEIKQGQHREALCVLYLGDVISWVLDRVLRSEIPFAYRGAIAIGEYEVSPHFLIGQAIDEAAAAHELAQGAIIWLTPAARDRVADWLRVQPGTHMVKFDVPLKGGDTLNTYTLSSLEQAKSVNDAELLTHNLLTTFSSQSIDVAVKRQNTIRHMRACYQSRGFEPSSLLESL